MQPNLKQYFWGFLQNYFKMGDLKNQPKTPILTKNHQILGRKNTENKQIEQKCKFQQNFENKQVQALYNPGISSSYVLLKLV